VSRTTRRTVFFVLTFFTLTDGTTHDGYRSARVSFRRLETILTLNFPRERRYTYSHTGVGPPRGASPNRRLTWIQFEEHLR